MQRNTYEYGKRLGKEVINKANGKDFLTNMHAWNKVRAMLREDAGYEDNETYSNLNNQGYKNSSFQVEIENSKKKLDNEIIPSFRKGFYDGLTE